MKRIILFLLLCSMCLCMAGCKHSKDHVEIYNESQFSLDNINIDVKEGYFYDRHEKFTVDENTVAITIYFTNLEDGDWEEGGTSD